MKFRTAKALAAVVMAGSFVATMLPSMSPASGAASTVSATTFTTSFSTMKLLKGLVTKSNNVKNPKVAFIVPDTTTSARYDDFDIPFMKDAFKAAGFPSKDVIIQNGEGSDNVFYTDAVADVANHVGVLIIDPEDSTVGSAVEGYAFAHGVKVIDYDRLTLGGERAYYVSFNGVTVGTQQGNGLLSCITAWNVKTPHVLVMFGSPTDNNATLFADGYDPVLKAAGYSPGEGAPSSANTTNEAVGTWTASQALTDFEGAYTANPSINAVLTPNDENAGPIIAYLQNKGLPPDTIPFTGQDATVQGFQNIISGYQCGTVYKPIFEEASAAAALSIYIRAGVKPPHALVNSSTVDSGQSISKFKNVPSVLLTSTWVTTANIESTVIAQKFLTAASICTSQSPTVTGLTLPTFAADCTKYGVH
jgi:D-xylose transport system substrate-binding protein